MTFEHVGVDALDYQLCRYGTSNLAFRGPKTEIDGRYCAVIGGTETFGKFIEQPFPALLGNILNRKVVNLGCKNAGVDAFSRDATVLDMCSGAQVTIVQVTGAQNLSNRFYSVHPRRNDRFLNSSGVLHAIYRDLDLTHINFTRHLVEELEQAEPAKFARVRDELKQNWVTKMQNMLSRIDGKIILLWLADHSPDQSHAPTAAEAEPLFVDREMLNQLGGFADALVEVVSSPDEVQAGFSRMLFSPMEEMSAREMLGPVVHERVAKRLSATVAELCP